MLTTKYVINNTNSSNTLSGCQSVMRISNPEREYFLNFHNRMSLVLLCTQHSQEFVIHSFVETITFLYQHKTAQWNVVYTRVQCPFYYRTCGSIRNLIWIFSLEFDIHYLSRLNLPSTEVIM